ncbi:MAG: hypothetical protein RPS47_01100 [Colwellia sp.]|jgi:hypothetical protein
MDEKLVQVIEQSFREQRKWEWRTVIERVYVFLDEVQFDVVRPDSGTNTGGVAYIWDEDGKLILNSKVPGNKTTTVSLKSDLLDFEGNIYTIGYGPDQVDQSINAAAAFVTIVQGVPGNFEPSICYGFNNSSIHVTSQYQFPKEIESSGCQIYVVEGNELKDSSSALEGNIYIFNEGEPYKGLVKLDYSLGSFHRGNTYTVCLNVYSWKRQIAGYSFIY